MRPARNRWLVVGEGMNEVYRSYFPYDPPARMVSSFGTWTLPFDIEIECVATV